MDQLDDEDTAQSEIEEEELEDDLSYEYESDYEDTPSIKKIKSKYQNFPYRIQDVQSNIPDQLQIFNLLKEVFETTFAQGIQLEIEWEIANMDLFYCPMFHFPSVYDDTHPLTLSISFKKQNFSDFPFSFLPLNSYPPQIFYSIMFHPLLKKENWNPFRDWSSVFIHMFKKLKRYEPGEWIAGGTLKVEDEQWWVQPANFSSAPLEYLIAKWYGTCQREIPFEIWCGENFFDDFESQLVGIPEVKKEFKKYQGIGYLAPESADKLTHLDSSQKILIATIESRICNNMENQKLIDWLMRSPLLSLVCLRIRDFNGYYPSSEASEWFCLFKLLAYFERFARNTSSDCVDLLGELKGYFQSLCQYFCFDIQSGAVGDEMACLRELSELCGQVIEQAYDSQPEKTMNMTAVDNEALVWEEGKRVYYVSMDLKKSSAFYSTSCVEGTLTIQSIRTIQKELKFLQRELIPQITLFVSEQSIQHMMFAMTIDEPENPYFGGIYVFHMLIPSDYPNRNPKVQFVTTQGGQVRFNPNLYNCGKVCLSLLGTWEGPSWDPNSSSLNQLLNSIYFLIFTNDPFFNEPGFERDRDRYTRDSDAYTAQVRSDVIPAALRYHLEHPCPVLNTWIMGCLRNLWPKCRDWFYSNLGTYDIKSSDLQFLDEICNSA